MKSILHITIYNLVVTLPPIMYESINHKSLYLRVDDIIHHKIDKLLDNYGETIIFINCENEILMMKLIFFSIILSSHKTCFGDAQIRTFNKIFIFFCFLFFLFFSFSILF